MIRKLTSADWQDYKEVRLQSLQTDPDVYFSTFEELSAWPDGNFKSEIYSRSDSPFGYIGYFYPRAGGDLQLVGYISLAGSYFAKQKHVADVFNLYVVPEYRGKGIARTLVTAIISEAREAGYLEKLFLSVMSQNTPAISLYTKLGFTTYGTKHHSLKSGDRYFDEVLMEFSLEEK